MQNQLRCALLIALPLVFGPAQAFERVEVSFAPAAGAVADSVRISFVGKTFDPALDVLKSDPVPDKEVRQFQEFLKNLHRFNLDGTKEAILRLWAPSERSRIETEMDAKSLAENKARFQAMTSLKLRGIIKYGSYYILFTRTEYAAGGFPLKLAVKSMDGNVYLSNELNGDAFYDSISHFIDSPAAKLGR